MIFFSLLYFWLAEPFEFQKEASARNLIRQMGERYVQGEYRHFTESAECKLNRDLGRSDFPGMGGFRFAVIDCKVQTPCDTSITRPVWHEPFLGAYMTAEPYSESIGEVCLDMLTEEARQHFEKTWQQGG